MHGEPLRRHNSVRVSEAVVVGVLVMPFRPLTAKALVREARVTCNCGDGDEEGQDQAGLCGGGDSSCRHEELQGQL